jgi:hypothetical protein
MTYAEANAILTALNAAFVARTAGGAIESYTVQGTNIAYCPLDKLAKLITDYSAICERLNPAGKKCQYRGPLFVR